MDDMISFEPTVREELEAYRKTQDAWNRNIGGQVARIDLAQEWMSYGIVGRFVRRLRIRVAWFLVAHRG